MLAVHVECIVVLCGTNFFASYFVRNWHSLGNADVVWKCAVSVLLTQKPHLPKASIHGLAKYNWTFCQLLEKKNTEMFLSKFHSIS